MDEYITTKTKNFTLFLKKTAIELEEEHNFKESKLLYDIVDTIEIKSDNFDATKIFLLLEQLPSILWDSIEDDYEAFGKFLFNDEGHLAFLDLLASFNDKPITLGQYDYKIKTLKKLIQSIWILIDNSKKITLVRYLNLFKFVLNYLLKN